MADSNLGDIIGEALESIKQLAGVNTIIGEPISAPGGTTIIPVSKVSMGFASGGLDIPAKAQKNGDGAAAKEAVQKKGKGFGGGGGTGLSVTPIGFLVVKADGDVQLLNIAASAAGTVGKNSVESIADLIERSPDIVSRFKDLFGGKDKEKEKVINADESKPSDETK